MEEEALAALDPAVAEALRAMQHAIAHQRDTYMARIALLEGAVQQLTENKADVQSLDVVREKVSRFEGFTYQTMLEELKSRGDYLEEGMARQSASIHKLDEKKADKISLQAFGVSLKHFQLQIDKVTDLMSCKVDRSELARLEKANEAFAEELQHVRGKVEEGARAAEEARAALYAMGMRLSEVELQTAAARDRLDAQLAGAERRAEVTEARVAAVEAELRRVSGSTPGGIPAALAGLERGLAEARQRLAAQEAAALAARAELERVRGECATEAAMAGVRGQLAAFAHDLGLLHSMVAAGGGGGNGGGNGGGGLAPGASRPPSPSPGPPPLSPATDSAARAVEAAERRRLNQETARVLGEHGRAIADLQALRARRPTPPAPLARGGRQGYLLQQGAGAATKADVAAAVKALREVRGFGRHAGTARRPSIRSMGLDRSGWSLAGLGAGPHGGQELYGVLERTIADRAELAGMRAALEPLLAKLADKDAAARYRCLSCDTPLFPVLQPPGHGVGSGGGGPPTSRTLSPSRASASFASLAPPAPPSPAPPAPSPAPRSARPARLEGPGSARRPASAASARPPPAGSPSESPSPPPAGDDGGDDEFMRDYVARHGPATARPEPAPRPPSARQRPSSAWAALGGGGGPPATTLTAAVASATEPPPRPGTASSERGLPARRKAPAAPSTPVRPPSPSPPIAAVAQGRRS